jgi:hypothetical protein
MSDIHGIAMHYPARQSDATAIPDDPEHTTQVDEPTPTGSTSNGMDLTSDISESNNDTNLEVIIGSVMSNGRFKCAEHGCYRRSFGRQAELRRHYYGAHTKKLAYWCEVAWCDRSQAIGTRPFPRKDKLRAHVRSMHGDRAKVHERLSGVEH